MRRYAAAAVLLMLRLAGAQTELPPAGLPALVKAIKPAVVSLIAFDPDKAMPGTGTGFLVGPDRLITCRHVLARCDRIEARLADGRTAHVTGLLAEDRAWDLALVQIEPALPDVTPLTVSDRLPAEGESLLAAGGPLGLEWTFSVGIVSAVRKIDNGLVVQHTAAISGGSSGGPVLDLSGKVIGVQSSMLTANGDSVVQAGQSLNFAISATRIGLLRAGEPRPLTKVRGDLAAGWRPPVHIALDQIALRPFVRGDYQGSLAYYNDAVQREPKVADNWFRLGICHEHLNSFTDAARAYRQCISLDPTQGMAHNNLGVVLLRQLKYADAIETFSRAASLRPDNGLVWANLSDAYYRLFRFGEALTAADEGLRHDARTAALHYNRGMALLALNRKPDALGEVKALASLDKAESARLQRECDRVRD